ncbi:MAG: molecular chaperone TorD family protein [Deltaproteobacteria bacterium]|nr:molecular chaperone TorD family protein [Deltaproteobacteria bacterium]MBW2396008.1 molecular chaperone TorD family protein [Deltaproteobacteria bacterium]
MSDSTAQEFFQPEARAAAARSHAYAALAQLFAYPDVELREDIQNGALETALRTILRDIDPALVEPANWSALGDAGVEPDDLAVEYTRLFDAGTGGPPCPLHGGLYAGTRMKTMEEAVRFYNHFGLTLADEPRELPDHLITQLEFMHFLAFREANALESGEDSKPFRCAQRDFLSRHPGRWVPELRSRVGSQEPMPFFGELVARLGDFLAHDQAHLIALAGPVPGESTTTWSPQPSSQA